MAVEDELELEALSEASGAWIGLSGDDGVWTWPDGSEASFTSWAEDEPAWDSGCVALDEDLNWEVLPCEELRTFVCEPA